MTAVREYVKNLSDSDREAIISSYEQYEHDGFTGETMLRIHTNALMEVLGASPYHITMWMTQLATECYRYYAVLYFKSRV